MSGAYEQSQPDYDKEAIEAERDHLQALQARQEIVLKRNGVFSRGVAELHRKHREQEQAYANGKSDQRPSWQPPEIDGSDGTRVVLGIYEYVDPVSRTSTYKLNLLFTIPNPSNPDFPHLQAVTVGETYGDLGATLPTGPFDNDDVTVANGLLDEMRQSRAKGELPHLKDSLDDLGPVEASLKEPPAA